MNMVKRGKTDESNISLSVKNKSYSYEIVKNRVYYQAKFSVSSQCMINIEDSYRHRGLRKHLVESLKEDKWGVNPETDMGKGWNGKRLVRCIDIKTGNFLLGSFITIVGKQFFPDGWVARSRLQRRR